MCNFSLRAFGAVIVLVLLAACSPALDWREVSAADGSVKVAFPARPASETRPLPIAGQSVPFTLTAATANGAVFAVGHLDLPDSIAADPTQREQYKQVLEKSLAQNLQADELVRRPVQVRHLAGAHMQPADEIELHGTPGGKPAWLLGRVVVVGNRLIQVAAVGPQDALSPEAARTFVDSLRLQ